MTKCAKIKIFIKKADYIMSLEDELSEYEFMHKMDELKDEYNNLILELPKLQDCSGYNEFVSSISSFSLN